MHFCVVFFVEILVAPSIFTDGVSQEKKVK